MKQLLVIVIALGLGLGASAQRFGHGYGGRGHVFVAPPRVSVGIGYSPFYSPFGYSPFGYPYGYGSMYARPYRSSKLEIQIEDIKNDYSDKIWSAKHDDSLSRKERRRVVHELKVERDQAVNDAKRDYYKK